MIFDYTNSAYWEQVPFAGFYPTWDGANWTFDCWSNGNGSKIQTKGSWSAGFRPISWEISIDPDFLVGGPLTASLKDSGGGVISAIPSPIIAPGTYSTTITGQTTDIRFLVLESTNVTLVYPNPQISSIKFNDSAPLFWQDRIGTNELLVGNELLKLKEISYTPGTPGFASSPGSPYQPAYTSYETVSVCRWRYVPGMTQGHWVTIGGTPNLPGESVGPERRVFIQGPGQNRGITYWSDSVFTCEQETIATFHPEQPYYPPVAAVPPTESQMSIELNMGWNAGARSIASFDVDGYVEFNPPNPLIGAVLGLASEHQESGYSQITHGFYFSGGVAYIIESGKIVKRVDVYGNGENFRIYRVHDVVNYWHLGEIVHTSEVTSAGEVFLEAVLYSGDDYVAFPVILAQSGIVSEMMPMAARPPGYTEMLPMVASDRQRFGKMQPMKTLAYSGQAGIPAFAPMISVSSDKPYAESRGSFLPMRGSAAGGLIAPSYAICNNAMVPMISTVNGLTGTIGSAEGQMQPMTSRSSDHNYGEVITSFEPMQSASYAYYADTVFFLQQALMVDDSLARKEMAVVLSNDMQIATTITGSREAIASVLAIIQMNDTVSTRSEMLARMQTVVYVSFDDAVGDTAGGKTVWVVNTNTQASTRYENFDFNSFGKWNGAYYGMKSDGLYLLEGDTDEGIPIDAMVSFGVQRFGDTLYKRVPTVYIGARSNGKLILRVKDGDKEYLYETRTSSPKLATQRFDIGRGIRANALEFELYNQNGNDFELASIEFIQLLTKRKQ